MMTPEGPAKECGELTAAVWQTAWGKLTEWTDIVEGSPIKTRVKFFTGATGKAGTKGSEYLSHGDYTGEWVNRWAETAQLITGCIMSCSPIRNTMIHPTRSVRAS